MKMIGNAILAHFTPPQYFVVKSMFKNKHLLLGQKNYDRDSNIKILWSTGT